MNLFFPLFFFNKNPDVSQPNFDEIIDIISLLENFNFLKPIELNCFSISLLVTKKECKGG